MSNINKQKRLLISRSIINTPARQASRSEGMVHAEGRPPASWLRQVESYLKDMGITDLASAWAMARRRPKEYRHTVDAVTSCSGVWPPYLT